MVGIPSGLTCGARGSLLLVHFISDWFFVSLSICVVDDGSERETGEKQTDSLGILLTKVSTFVGTQGVC